MIIRYSGRRPAFSRWIAAHLALALVLLMLPTGVAAASADSGQEVPSVPGYPPVDSPQVTAPAPLPGMDGTVPVDTDLRIGTGGATSSGGATTLRSRTAETSTALAAAAAPNGKVALRALVVAVDTGDWGVDTWKATLDRVGAAYDVLYTGTAPADRGHAGAAGRHGQVQRHPADQQQPALPGRRRVPSSAACRTTSGTCCGPTSATTGCARPPSTTATAPGRRTTACAPAARAAWVTPR